MLEATLLESIQEIIFTLRRIKFLLLEHIGTQLVSQMVSTTMVLVLEQ